MLYSSVGKVKHVISVRKLELGLTTGHASLTFSVPEEIKDKKTCLDLPNVFVEHSDS